MNEPIRLRDLPGVAELEAALHVSGRQLDKQYDNLVDRIEDLCRRLFGISWGDTHFHFKEADLRRPQMSNVDGKRQPTTEGWAKNHQWEENFNFLHASYGEENTFWSAFDWDVTDGNGNRLLIMKYFGRSLVCLLKQLHPDSRFSPTAEKAGETTEVWEQKLAADALSFQSRRRV